MRFRVLDLYRFFAAVLVMAYHYVTSFNVRFHGSSPYVDFFFMLSGFVIMRGYQDRAGTARDYVDFIWARFSRLYPLHFATTSFWFVLALAAGAGAVHAGHAQLYDASGAAQNYLLIHAWGTTSALSLNLQSWSISAEWALYLAFPLFLMLYRHVGRFGLIGFALAAVAALEMANALWLPNSRPWLEWTYDFGALRAVPSFVLGMWMSTIADHAAASRAPGLKTGLALFLLSVPLNIFEAPRLLVLAVLAAALFFTACGELRNQKSWLADRRLGWLGDASYAIYMLHMITLPIACEVLRPWLHDAWPTDFIVMPITIAVSVASYVAFERPAQRWLLALRAQPQEHPALRRYAQLRRAQARLNPVAFGSHNSAG